jgi:hypothetical protein
MGRGRLEGPVVLVIVTLGSGLRRTTIVVLPLGKIVFLMPYHVELIVICRVYR